MIQLGYFPLISHDLYFGSGSMGDGAILEDFSSRMVVLFGMDKI
jgi:hypothetical protein